MKKQARAQVPQGRRRLIWTIDRIDPVGERVRVERDMLQRGSDHCQETFVEAYKKAIEREGIFEQVFKDWRKIDKTSQGVVLQIGDPELLNLTYNILMQVEKYDLKQEIRVLREEFSLNQEFINGIRQQHRDVKKQLDQVQELALLEDERRQESEKTEVDMMMASLLQVHQKKISAIQTEQLGIQEKIRSAQQLLLVDQMSEEMLKALVHTVEKLIRELLIDSIVYIVETTKKPFLRGDKEDPTVCHVIFEQSYPSLMIPRSKLMKVLGPKNYLAKRSAFELIMKSTPARQSVKKQMFFCHRCMETFPSELLRFCSKPPGPKQLNPMATSDSRLYKKSFLDNDYFSEAVGPENVLPYFAYCKNSKQQPLCNRAYCHKCIETCYPDLVTKKSFRCPFCTGTCGCRRCELGINTVRMMAFDLKNSGNDTSKRYYHRLAAWFKQNHNKHLHSMPLRRSTEEYSVFEGVYLEALKEDPTVSVSFTCPENPMSDNKYRDNVCLPDLNQGAFFDGYLVGRSNEEDNNEEVSVEVEQEKGSGREMMADGMEERNSEQMHKLSQVEMPESQQDLLF